MKLTFKERYNEYCKMYFRRFGREYHPDEPWLTFRDFVAETQIKDADRVDRLLIAHWNGQESADEQYNGVFDLSLIII